jgi:hypothetical protein
MTKDPIGFPPIRLILVQVVVSARDPGLRDPKPWLS